MNILYPARIKYVRTDKRYMIQFIDLAEAISEAETLEEALFNASEVLTLTLEGRFDEKIEIPHPSKKSAKNIYHIAPSARIQAALLFRFAKGKHTKAEIARNLNTSWPSISRFEDPHHWPSLRQLERVAAALDQRLIISLEPTKP